MPFAAQAQWKWLHGGDILRVETPLWWWWVPPSTSKYYLPCYDVSFFLLESEGRWNHEFLRLLMTGKFLYHSDAFVTLMKTKWEVIEEDRRLKLRVLMSGKGGWMRALRTLRMSTVPFQLVNFMCTPIYRREASNSASRARQSPQCPMLSKARPHCHPTMASNPHRTSIRTLKHRPHVFLRGLQFPRF